MSAAVSGLNRYLVKSCRGEPLESAYVEPWGLAGDRRWMVIDADGEAVTARDFPQLILVTPQTDGDTLRLARADGAELTVRVPDPGDGTSGPLVESTVWGNPVRSSDAGAAAHAWFSEVIGRPVRLVYLDDPTRRRPNPAYSKPEDRVSFADGYPLLLTTGGSLAALNELIAGGPHSGEGPLPMTRFRPSLVVDGTEPWVEDGWRRIRVGPVTFRIAKGCDRCVLTTIDPWTAKKGREPLVTLARHRNWGGKIWFGVNLIPETTGTLRLGDPVEVLE